MACSYYRRTIGRTCGVPTSGLSQLAALISQSQMNELELTELRRVARGSAPRCSRANMPPCSATTNAPRKQRSGRAASTARARLTGERVRGVARGRATGARAGGGPRGAARREGQRGAPCKGPREQAALEARVAQLQAYGAPLLSKNGRGDRGRIVVSASRFAHQHGVFQRLLHHRCPASVNGRSAGTPADVRVRLDACVAQ
ncbi:hypothetical protein EDB89DRAFT_1978782 [Lactarius sanguifluus]|nr:hypothetical protein EDB89DRAFT_1978782 [Lactarius sanguifluus]